MTITGAMSLLTRDTGDTQVADTNTEHAAATNPPVDEKPVDAIGGALGFTTDPNLAGTDTPDVGGTADQEKIDALGGSYNTIASDQLATHAPKFDAAGVATDLADNVTVKDSSSFVTPAMMVEDRMANLLDPNSNLMRTTTARGDALANSLGLQSSRKGAAISEGLVMDRAQSIAERDAATNSAFGQLEAKTDYGITDKQASGIVSGGLNEQQWAGTNVISAFDKALKGADAVNSAKISALQTKWEQDYNTAVTNFNTQYDDMISKRNISAAVAEASKDRVGEAITNYQIFAENTITSPEMLDKGWDAVANVLNQGSNLLTGYMSYELSTTGASDVGLTNFVDSIKWDL